MTWRVRVRPEAELDLLVAAGWYEAQRQGLGAEFFQELSLLVASLADNALLYAERLEGVRGPWSLISERGSGRASQLPAR